jgi:aconitase A
MATDAALFITAQLRRANVVDEIVEFCGPALDHLTLTDRATIANMCPEYGATAALFPVDRATLDYMAAMGRPVADYEAYARKTGLWRDAGPPRLYSRRVTIDLGKVETDEGQVALNRSLRSRRCPTACAKILRRMMMPSSPLRPSPVAPIPPIPH